MGENKSSSKSSNATRKSPAALALPVNFDNEDNTTHAFTNASTLISSVVDDRLHPHATCHPIEHPSDLGGTLCAAQQREAHACALAIDATKDADDTESA